MLTSWEIFAKRHLHTLKKNSGGNRVKWYVKVETSVTRTLITHGNDWYQQGTEQLLWRHVRHHHHHHHHVPEGLSVFPVPWSSRWSWSLYLFFGRPVFLRPFGLYCSACFGSLCPSSVHVAATFSWYCFISFSMFCNPVFPLIHWYFYLVLLFQVSVSKISCMLLLKVVPLLSSVPKLHFQIAMLL